MDFLIKYWNKWQTYLNHLLQLILSVCTVPDAWKLSRVTSLPKTLPVRNTESDVHRIAITNSVAKVAESFVTEYFNFSFKKVLVQISLVVRGAVLQPKHCSKLCMTYFRHLRAQTLFEFYLYISVNHLIWLITIYHCTNFLLMVYLIASLLCPLILFLNVTSL